MGFRKKNAEKIDNKSSAKIIMGKPAKQLTNEDKKLLSARMAEIKKENSNKSTVQNTIPYQVMYRDGVCQVSDNFYSMTVQFFDANYSIAEGGDPTGQIANLKSVKMSINAREDNISRNHAAIIRKVYFWISCPPAEKRLPESCPMRYCATFWKCRICSA